MNNSSQRKTHHKRCFDVKVLRRTPIIWSIFIVYSMYIEYLRYFKYQIDLFFSRRKLKTYKRGYTKNIITNQHWIYITNTYLILMVNMRDLYNFKRLILKILPSSLFPDDVLMMVSLNLILVLIRTIEGRRSKYDFQVGFSFSWSGVEPHKMWHLMTRTIHPVPSYIHCGRIPTQKFFLIWCPLYHHKINNTKHKH